LERRFLFRNGGGARARGGKRGDKVDGLIAPCCCPALYGGRHAALLTVTGSKATFATRNFVTCLRLCEGCQCQRTLTETDQKAWARVNLVDLPTWPGSNPASALA
jgi:hypothetical protein